jgi:SP family general alpha glucoside:H+ symporter-like MFS transporter
LPIEVLTVNLRCICKQLMLLNATIFIMFFANSLPVFFVSQIAEGIPWGIFVRTRKIRRYARKKADRPQFKQIANAPAYCSEIVPMRLRAPATQVLQLFWAIGAIIVGGVTYVYQKDSGSSAWK